MKLSPFSQWPANCYAREQHLSAEASLRDVRKESSSLYNRVRYLRSPPAKIIIIIPPPPVGKRGRGYSDEHN